MILFRNLFIILRVLAIFLRILIKKVTRINKFYALCLENYFKFFLVFLEKVIENNKKKVKKPITIKNFVKINEEIKNEMIKYKNENQILLNKISELEQKINENNNKFSLHKKELLENQSKIKKENLDYCSQIVDLQNKIGII